MGKRKSDEQDATKESKASVSQQSDSEPSPAAAHSNVSGGDKSQNGATKRPNIANGSWRGKATAVAEIARESITAGGGSLPGTTPGRPASVSANRRSSGLMTPTRSTPSVASVSKVNATYGSSGTGTSNESDLSSKEGAEDKSDEGEKSSTVDEAEVTEQTQERPLPSSGWRGWWSRAQEEKSEAENAAGTTSDELSSMAQLQTQDKSGAESEANPATNHASVGTADNKSDTQVTASLNRSSWFGLWGPTAEEAANSPTLPNAKGNSVVPSQSSHEASAEPIIAPPKKATDENETSQHRTSGSWSFWSRDTGSNTVAKGQLTTQSGKTDETQPSADDNQAQETKDNKKSAQGTISTTQANQKRAGNVSSQVLETNTSGLPSSLAEASKDSQPTERTQDKKAGKAMPPNILLPAFHKTYRLAQTPSYWQQLFRMFGRQDPKEQRHLSIATSFPRIKTAMAIGIHGYFPSPIVQKVLGPPTGTSIRFAKSAAMAIKKWADAHGQPCDVEMVALEGEGMITSRLDSLWKLLLNWIEQIRKADFIMVACHSQGVPVACLLVERLINFGVLNANVRIGICAMAGVNLGPFASYRNRFLDAAASELFSFSQPSSTVSKLYASAIESLLAHHVRVTYIGSIDDQLVSMESSTFSNISHPYIYRAVFVDGRIHAPDFLTHLVGFALKLRNLGIPDHGLVRELSGPLAGSLYGGEGHSRIYLEPGVYDLAVQFALETTSLSSVSAASNAHGTTTVTLERIPYEVPAATPNPYFLPWAMRGLLEEEFVRTELKSEVSELLEQFESWKPQSKVLMDVRFRLEAVKSKL